MDHPFEIYKTFVSSSAHVLENDIETMYRTDFFLAYDHDYGVTIYLHDEAVSDISRIRVSDGMRLLILFSVSNECTYLKIDSDGPIYDSFPTYDW